MLHMTAGKAGLYGKDMSEPFLPSVSTDMLYGDARHFPNMSVDLRTGESQGKTAVMCAN